MAISNRDHIIDCAVEILKNIRYNDITIKDICTQAGVSRQTFYNYFKNKDEVYRAFFIKVSACMKLFNPPIEAGYLESKEYVGDIVKFFDDYSDVLLALENQNILWYLSRDLVSSHKSVLIPSIDDNYVHKYPDYFYIYTMSATVFICMKWIKKGKPETSAELVKIIKHYIDSNY